MENKYTHHIYFYHEHSGLKNINQGIGEVTTALSSICKHLSIQLSENENNINIAKKSKLKTMQKM